MQTFSILFSVLLVFVASVKGNYETTTDNESTSTIQTTTEDTEDPTVWTRQLVLDGGFEIKWFSQDEEFLIIEMSVITKGYVAVGFSPNGAMRGSDIVMGWVDDKGQGHIKDLHAVGNSAPLEDREHNYELLGHSENDGKTSIRFRRSWNTCDTKHDAKITDDTVRLIYAWGEEDPSSYSRRHFKPSYHGPNGRGVRSVYLKRGTHNIKKFPDEDMKQDTHVKIWDVRMDNVSVNGQETYYYCKLIKAQHLETKHQIIAYKPIFSEDHRSRIHHIIFYDCFVPETHGGSEAIFEKFINHAGGECYKPNMPPEWPTHCISMPLVWTVGGDGLILPEHTGIPVGEQHGGTTYFMFEVHYHNPERLSFTDSSGMRLFLTDKPRQYDQSVIDVGNKLTAFHMIPPETSSFKTFSYCTPECTTKTIPPGGVNVTHVLLHSHTAGRKIIVRHIRNGQELPPLAKDDYYDFNYQEFITLQPERRILPGDILLTECTHDTSLRSKPTYAGLSAEDEMCIGFIHYYPRIALTQCRNQIEFHTFLNGLGIRKVEGEILKKKNLPYVPKDNEVFNRDDLMRLKNSTLENPLNIFDVLNIVDPPPEPGSTITTVGDYIKSLKWGEDDEKIAKFVEASWLGGKQYGFCTGHGKIKIPLKDYIVHYPKFLPFQEKDEKCSKLLPKRKFSRKPYPQVRSFGYFSDLLMSRDTFN